MITEAFISSVLQASITGAGLIFAVYAIIVPNISKIAKSRLRNLEKVLSDLEETLSKTRKQENKKVEIDKLREKTDKLEELQSPPVFFNGMVIATFTLYLITTILSLWWFTETKIGSFTKDDFQIWIPWTFGIATLIFGVIGYNCIKTINDIYSEAFER
jgi:uncharacterized membrane protein (DUF106 family)